MYHARQVYMYHGKWSDSAGVTPDKYTCTMVSGVTVQVSHQTSIHVPWLVE